MAYIAIGINVISGLIYTPWMINSIGRENYGLYALAMSVISLFVFDFGLSAAVTRFLAKYLAEGRQDKANDCLGLVYRLYIYLDLLLFVILGVIYFFIPAIYKELTPDEIEKFKVVYLMASVYSVISFPLIPVGGILTAHEKFVQIKACDAFHKILIVGLMTICLWHGMGLYALVAVNVIAGIIMLTVKVLIINKSTAQRVNWRYNNYSEFINIIKFSGWVTVISISQRLIINLAPSFLAFFSGSSSIAILSIALTIEGYIYVFANAMNGMFLPKVSRIVSNSPTELLPLMIRVGRIQLLLVAMVIEGFFCLGQDFIQLWLGDKFADCYWCSVILVIPSLISLPQEVASSAVYAMNKVKRQAMVYIITSVLNVALLLVLTPFLGALGVCITICITYLLRMGWMDVIYYREMKINIIDFFTKSFGKLSIPLIITLVTGILISTIVNIPLSWLSFLIKVALFAMTYSLIMWFFAMNSYEKDMILSLIRRIKLSCKQ